MNIRREEPTNIIHAEGVNNLIGRGRNGFAGREWDPDTELYYYRARYYDPQARRFISEDPIGLAGGIKLYAYVGNNPINAIDPLGLLQNILKYNNVMGSNQNSNPWYIQWELANPSIAGGWIVPHITMFNPKTKKSFEYWEAWAVPPNSVSTKRTIKGECYDDSFTSGLKGAIINAEARFYEGLKGPENWLAPNPLTFFSGELPASKYDLHFSINDATPPVIRSWTAK